MQRGCSAQVERADRRDWAHQIVACALLLHQPATGMALLCERAFPAPGGFASSRGSSCSRAASPSRRTRCASWTDDGDWQSSSAEQVDSMLPSASEAGLWSTRGELLLRQMAQPDSANADQRRKRAGTRTKAQTAANILYLQFVYYSLPDYVVGLSV